MPTEKKNEYSGIKVESIDEVKERKDLTPKSGGFPIASKELEESLGNAFGKGELKEVLNHVESSSENTYRQVGRVEVKAFDSAFLEALESGLDAISRIIANPRTFIKETHEIENVEKARKVSVASIQHFATHSQYLRSVEENGEVIPDKILTIHSETNTAIYENRFVMTLIKRTLLFIEQRTDFIEEHGETLDSDELFVRSKANFGGVDYEVSMRVRASVPSSDAGESEKNESLLKRLSFAKQRCGDFLRSNFMNQMKGAKDISSPVHMTNMLLKHPDYHAAYELWEVIDQYESLGVSYDVQEEAIDFDEEYLRSLNELVAHAMLKLRTRHKEKSKAGGNTHAKRLTPTVIFSLDEIGYEDSRFLYDAYPDAKPHSIDPLDIVEDEKRDAIRDQRLSHLANEKIAEIRLNKEIKKDKDRKVIESAKHRDGEKGVLEAKAKEKKRAEKEKERKLKEEKAVKEAKAKEAKRAEEERLYEQERRKYVGGGKK